MSRNKAFAALLASLCLAFSSAMAESPSLISPDMIKIVDTHYDAYTVQKGEFIRDYTANAQDVYPYTYNLRCQVSGAKFVEYTVRQGDRVKAGDVLAVFSLQTDEVARAALEQQLRNLREDRDAQLTARQESIASLQEDMQQETDMLARQILSLRLQKAQVALEQYAYQQEQAIAELEADIAEADTSAADTTLVAPCDCVVDTLTYLRTGDLVPTGEVLIKLYRDDTVLLRIDNTNGYFRCGMDVSVETGAFKDRMILPGKVVGADDLLPQSRRSGYAYIEADLSLMGDARRVRTSVTGHSVYLDQVLTIPRSAVTLDAGKYQVQRLVDGKPMTRMVNRSQMNNTHVWILQGLSEGDQIIMD